MPFMIGALSVPTPEPLGTSWPLVALRGVAAMLFGVSALVIPAQIFDVLVILFATLCLVDGAVNAALAVRCARANARWSGLATHAVVALAIGAAIFVYPPAVAGTLVLVVALWAVVSGMLMIDLAANGGLHAGRLALVAVGVLHLTFGMSLAASSVLGALLLTWWIGLNAIIVGVAHVLLALGLRTRSGGFRSTPAAAA